MNHIESDQPHSDPQRDNPVLTESEVPSDERTWATLLIVSGLSVLVGVPFGNIILPLVIWIFKKEDSPLIDAVGKEVLNFQITYAIYAIVAGLTVFIFIGFVLVPLVLIAWLVLTIVGAMKANQGVLYRYPATMRFIG